MTNTFRKHHKTIMWVIIVGTIISFVAFLSPSMRGNGGGGGRTAADLGTINGEAVTQAQLDAAMQEARLSMRFTRTGRWPSPQEEQQVMIMAYETLFTDAKLKELNITVTPEATARFTRHFLGIPEGQAFPKDKFDEFVRKELNENGKCTFEDFDRFMSHQAGEQLLVSLYGMNGKLISQKEAEFFLRRENEMMEVELVSFPITNFSSRVTVLPQDVETFYTQKQADYRLPERERVNYIRFDASNYLAVADQMLGAISNLDSRIEQDYVAADPATFKDDAGAQLTPEAAKVKIKETYRKQLSQKAAQTNAIDIAKKLEGRTTPITKADIDSLAATNGLVARTTEPFDQKNPPKDWEMPPAALAVVFQLETNSVDDQFKLFPGTNSIYLVALDQKFPSESQPLEAVRARVTDDYRTNKATEMSKAIAAKFEAAVRAGLGKGQSFDTLCAAQGFRPETLTPFSLNTPSIPDIDDKNDFETVVRTIYELPAGQVSAFTPLPSGGFIAYVKSRTPADDAIVQRDAPAYLEKMRDQRQFAAFRIWIDREFRAHVQLPKRMTTG